MRHKNYQDNFLVLSQTTEDQPASNEERNELQNLLDKAIKYLEHQIQEDQQALYLLQDIPFKNLDTKDVNELVWHDLSAVKEYIDPELGQNLAKGLENTSGPINCNEQNCNELDDNGEPIINDNDYEDTFDYEGAANEVTEQENDLEELDLEEHDETTQD